MFFVKIILVIIIWNDMPEKILLSNGLKNYRPIKFVKFSKFSISLTTWLFGMVVDWWLNAMR